MSCKCPVCGRITKHVGTLYLHLTGRNTAHLEWLESYCQSKGLNYGQILSNGLRDVKDATKPLTNLLKEDFCDRC